MNGFLKMPVFRMRARWPAVAAMLACLLPAALNRVASADDAPSQETADAPADHVGDAASVRVSVPVFLEDDFDTGVVSCCEAPDCCDQCRQPYLTVCNRLTVGAEYLLLRPTLGNDTALYQTTITGGKQLANTALNYDFGYTSGVRGFLGYRLSDDWLVRFAYLTVGSSAGVAGTSSGNWIGGNGTGFIGPYDTVATVAGQSIQSRMDAGLDVYDLEIAGRVNATRCDADGRPSPWEAAAAVGLRFADVGIDSNVFNDQTAVGQLNQVFVTTSRGFHGVGPRLALQGRRYLDKRRSWSVFASGAAALLVGSFDNTDTRFRRRNEGGGVISTNFQSQRDAGRLVVPNLDLSLGVTWQVGRRTSFSAGWMLMYWGQVGYAEGISTAPANANLPALVPLTSSSLSYDGAFFKLTHNF